MEEYNNEEYMDTEMDDLLLVEDQENNLDKTIELDQIIKEIESDENE